MLEDQAQLKKSLLRLVEAVVREAGRNPEFARDVRNALGDSGRKPGMAPRKALPRIPGNPLDIFASGGEQGLKDWLAALDLEVLKAIVREHRLDPSRLSDKWKTTDRFISLILDRIPARHKQGGAFRGYGGRDFARRRLDDDWSASGLANSRRYFLQAYPVSAAVVEGVGLHSGSRVRAAFSDPPAVRHAGFGLGIRSEPETLPQGGLRVTQRREVRTLERSGLLSWTCSADRDFLAWVSDRRKQPNSLHPLALAESTYCFFLLFLEYVVPAMQPQPATWFVRGGMADLFEDQPPTSLCAGPLGDEVFHDLGKEWHKSPASSFQFELELISRAPGEAALRVLREVYANFGLDEKAIPYREGNSINPKLFPVA